MRYRSASPLMLGVFYCCALLALRAGAAHGQAGTIRGVVTDTTGAAVASADVAIVALHRLTRTDEQGHFFFDKLPRGGVELSVRRLGFRPQTVKATVTESVTYSFAVALEVQPAVLDPLSIDAPEQRLRLGIEDFYRRRARGVGRYFTRDEIEQRGAKTTSDVFRSTPGVRIVGVRGGNGIRFTSSTPTRRNCVPLIWIDGQRAEGLEVDDIPVNDIEGIELYQGPATTPPQFWQGTLPECGTIVIWSRIPGG